MYKCLLGVMFVQKFVLLYQNNVNIHTKKLVIGLEGSNTISNNNGTHLKYASGVLAG